MPCRGRSACRTESQELGVLLEALANEPPSPITVEDDLRLVERADLPARFLDEAPVVSIRPADVRLEGEVFDGPALRSRLAERANRRVDARDDGPVQERGVGPRQRVYLMIDGATPWSRVVDVVDAAAAAGLEALEADAAADAIALPANASWREASPRFTPGMRYSKLAVEE